MATAPKKSSPLMRSAMGGEEMLPQLWLPLLSVEAPRIIEESHIDPALLEPIINIIYNLLKNTGEMAHLNHLTIKYISQSFRAIMMAEFMFYNPHCIIKAINSVNKIQNRFHNKLYGSLIKPVINEAINEFILYHCGFSLVFPRAVIFKSRTLGQVELFSYCQLIEREYIAAYNEPINWVAKKLKCDQTVTALNEVLGELMRAKMRGWNSDMVLAKVGRLRHRGLQHFTMANKTLINNHIRANIDHYLTDFNLQKNVMTIAGTLLAKLVPLMSTVEVRVHITSIAP